MFQSILLELSDVNGLFTPSFTDFQISKVLFHFHVRKDAFGNRLLFLRRLKRGVAYFQIRKLIFRVSVCRQLAPRFFGQDLTAIRLDWRLDQQLIILDPLFLGLLKADLFYNLRYHFKV